MADEVLHGLIQKAKLQAEALMTETRAYDGGAIWRHHPAGWVKIGDLPNPQDREDFLVGKLTQEDR